ncbi:hypothetical protein ACIRJS_33145 [Streptomyces sp. NPDC102340]|uniref:hypothetical protein n=1 Tax=unclassified Streptomyces TaxID=2593676 RepID=UPI0037F944A0
MPNPVHWHAYSYIGKSYTDAEIRRGVAPSNYPPIEIKDWLARPRNDITGTFTDVEAAVGWMKQQLTGMPPADTSCPVEQHLDWIRRTLAQPTGNDVVYGYYTSSGRYAGLAMIACPRPDVGRCPEGLA